MPRTRRALLAATASLAVGVLGGCVASDSPGNADASTTAQTTESPATTTHSTATPLPDRTVALPNGPKERPERPESLTLATARSYVKEFEYRYVYNQLWYRESTEVSLSCAVVDAREVDVGYEVVVSCTGSSTTGGDADGNDTATMVHADYFTQVYTYRLDEDSLVRRQATEEEKG